MTAVTALFVPGHRPDRFARAAAAGADLVIVDLEDAVPLDRKAEALDAALVALTDPASDFAAAIRIDVAERGGLAQAVSLMSSGARVAAVVVPKAEEASQLDSLVASLPPGTPLIPLVETARGVRNAAGLAAAANVERLAFGAYDFIADTSASGTVLLDHARCELVLASRAAGIAAPLDSPIAEFRDAEAVRKSAEHARTLGFGGKLCIHPDQVAVVATAFAPTAEEVEWARRILDATVTGVGQLDGVMVDRPIQLRAQSILGRSEASGPGLDSIQATSR